MASRRHFLQGAAAGMIALGLGTKELAAQLVGSSYKFIMGSGPGPETVVNGKKCLYFGGTGYFGFQTHPEVIKAAQKALADFGTCTATSRDMYGTSPLYLEVEKRVAQFFGTEQAIYLPSGYLINLSGFQSLVQQKKFDTMFVDDDAHWSITDIMYGLQKPVYLFKHGDPEDLEKQIKANLKPGEKPLVVSDGLFPTFGKIAPVAEHYKIIEKYDGCMWLDDCHSVGVLGANGRGTYEHYGLKSPRLYFGATLSKAFGAHGGMIASNAETIQPIREGHVVNGSNASLTGAAGAAIKGIQLMTAHPEMRQQLWRNARQLKSGLKKLGFDQDDSPVPVAAFMLKTAKDMDRVQDALFQRGISIQRTFYVGAGPEGLLRTVVFATHTPQQIDRLLSELKAVV
jgi:7-keto-8-aminopelargonate synthetase-like enzyme